MRRSQELPPRCPKAHSRIAATSDSALDDTHLMGPEHVRTGRMKTPKASGNARLGLSESQFRSYASTPVLERN